MFMEEQCRILLGWSSLTLWVSACPFEHGHSKAVLALVAQRLDPPYRAIGYSYTYRTYVFQVSQGIALFPPKLALLQPRRGGGKGYRSSSCPLQGIALYGGIAEIVSPTAV